MDRRRDRLILLAFLAALLAVWTVFLLLPRPKMADLPQNGDLTDCDLSDTAYRGADGWESWPQRLYTPADLGRGEVTEPPVYLSDADYRAVQYATHRLTITLAPGQLLALSMRSSDYAMRLYIDGVDMGSVGTPSNTWETTVPRVLDKTYYFTPQSEQVTLLVHVANFVHGIEGCRPPEFTLGTPERIGQLNTLRLIFSFAAASSLVTAFLYHLGLFLLGRGRKNALYLSVCCALFVLMLSTPIHTFFPGYNLALWLRAQYLVRLLACIAIIQFLRALFPGLCHRWVLRAVYIFFGMSALIILFTNTMFFTGLRLCFETAAALIILYTLLRLAIRLGGGSPQTLLAFIGMMGIALPGLWDIAARRGLDLNSPFLREQVVAPVGMVFFIFCYALVISMEYAEAERREQHLAAENASLDRLNLLKTDLMVTITHEARTPLAVLSSYAGLVSMQLRDKGVEPQIAADLDKVVFEAKRVANLIDSMGKLALPGGDGLRRVPLDISDVARQTAELYRHILERGGVGLTLTAEDSLPPVLGSPEELTQVLLNLLHNAKTATERGRVTITIGRAGGHVAVTLSDTGTGIEPGALPRVFQRGFSLSGGMGIGLALCKEIVENHGGTITLSSALGIGTAVTFTLPVCEGAGGTER